MSDIPRFINISLADIINVSILCTQMLSHTLTNIPSHPIKLHPFSHHFSHPIIFFPLPHRSRLFFTATTAAAGTKCIDPPAENACLSRSIRAFSCPHDEPTNSRSRPMKGRPSCFLFEDIFIFHLFAFASAFLFFSLSIW